MSLHSLPRWSLAVLALVAAAACGSATGEREPPRQAPVETEHATNGVEAAPPPSAPDSASREIGTPTVFTRISFDLRGMPHRGPHDVDPALTNSRVELLMQRTREAAGEPAPRLTFTPGFSVFRAEFFGTEAAALAQCRRAVATVAPEPDPDSEARLPPSADPEATPCTPIRDAAGEGP